MKKNKILSFIVTLIVAFIASVSAASASGWKTEASRCYDHPERALTIHYIVDGKEVNPSDPNAGSWFTVSSSKRYPCTTYYIPESYFNYNTGFGNSQKMFTNEDGTNGVIYWYDNPEFTGSPVMTISYTDIPESQEITLYAKTGKIINVYANGYKKKVVVGKTYSPMVMDPDYYVEAGVTHNGSTSVNYWNYSTEADYFSYASDYREWNSNPTYTYYRDRTYVKGGSTMLAMPAQYVHVDNTELIQFINYESCYGNDDYLYCKIADPETGEALTDKQVQQMLNDEYASATVGIHKYSRIPKYYKYFGFIDTQGREYAPEFVMQEEYDGRAFTTVVDGKMSCATDYISPYHSYDEVAKIYKTTIDFDGAEFSGDFNTNYLTKLKSYSGNNYYDNDKTNYQFSSCVPYDVNFKYTYKISNQNARWYTVVIEGTNGTKVTQGSIYKLPDSGRAKPSEITLIKLKYQDGITPDETLTYTKTYTPSGFKIDGVHYDFGQEIVVTRDLYITYDYTYELDGPDLPTPTRENYSFKGWYDMTIGGHLITNPKTLEAKTLYAQWNDADTVTIVRPDGIPIELEKGSEYTIPDIYDKDEVVNAKVSFNYNDRSGKVDVSEVITYYTKDGVVDALHDNRHYDCGEKIIANENMVLNANYIETVKPAKFPKDPERYGHDFLGWFDGVLSTDTQYTSYAGKQDLNLYAHWFSNINQISIHYPDYAPYNGATITIDEGESYTLSNILTNNTDLHDVTFNYNDAGLGDTTTPNEVQKVGTSRVGNGWYVDGILYAGGSVITPTEDVWLIEDTIDVEYEPIFPTPTDKDWYTFNGWYDQAEGGEKYTSYNTAEEKTFYAHWDEIPSKEITLGNVPSKADTNASSVTFNYNDNGQTSDLVRYVTKSYVADGWLVDGVHYYSGDKVTITKDSTIIPQYLESLNSVEFPADPTREDYTFKGWFDVNAATGGNQYTSYESEENITLYARWQEPSGSTSTILPGGDFAGKIRDLPNIDINAIKTFGKATESEYQAAYSMITSSDAYIISTNNSDVPTYLWFVNDRMLYYSEADTIYLNENCGSMFYKSQFKPQFTSIDISGMDSSKVTNMRAMFSGQSYVTTLNLGDFKTDNVTNMYNAFNGLNNLTSLDTSSWNTSNVTNMEGTFDSCRTLEELDVSNWDTSNVTNMKQLFYNMPNLKSLDVSKWDVSNVTTMEGMFNLDKKLTSIDLSSFDTEKLQRTSNMFASDQNLETIYVSEKWNMSGVTSSYGMFNNATSIVGQEGTTYDSNHVDKAYAHVDEGETNPGYLTYKAYTGKYKVTLPDKVIKVPAGSTYEIPENTYDKASTNGATVTFVYNNGHENTTSNVMTQYSKNGFTIGETHYDESDTIVVNSDITLVPDYIETIIGATFPSDPTDDDNVFTGWYDVNSSSGGTKYTSYNGTSDITLYARWVDGHVIENTYVCKRAKTLHSFGSTIFGNLGVSGELHTGDAFTCDVNGDGVWDETNERFYYISDYFDTHSLTFDDTTAALVYSNLIQDKANSDAGGALGTYKYYDTVSSSTKGPVNAYTILPSSSTWKNVSLKASNRQILAEFGNVHNSLKLANNQYLSTFTYTGKSSRFLTAQEYMRGCNVSELYSDYNQIIQADSSCKFLNEGTSKYSSTDTRGFHLETRNYENNQESWAWTNDKSGVYTNYLNILSPYSGVKPVIDVPKDKMEINIATFASIYIDGTKVKEVLIGSEYTLPEVSSKASDTYTVTFNYNDGVTSNTTSTVTKSYQADGYKLGEDSYSEGDKITVTDDIYLTSNYIENIIPATFPNDPTKANHTFVGWFSSENGGNKFTTYDKKSDITLYAHWYYIGGLPNDPSNILCKRATTLHTEECTYDPGTNGSTLTYCYGAGYFAEGSMHTSTITYGQLGKIYELNPGDAFDCDVNGDGVFDSETERFYYVSDYYNTTNDTFETDTAALIYYNNTGAGVPNNTKAVNYDYNGVNFNGPSTQLMEQLPTTSQWSNTSLKYSTRAIKSMKFNSSNEPQYYNYVNVTNAENEFASQGIHNLPSDYSYAGYAARLLTVNEALDVYPLINKTSSIKNTYYPKMYFLLENSKFSSGTGKSLGYYYETPYAEVSGKFRNYAYIWTTRAYYYHLDTNSSDYSMSPNFGARPVIDVPKSRIEDVPEINYHTISLPDYNDRIIHRQPYTIPDNTYDKANINLSKVTFDYQDGRENVVRYVENQYVTNGFKIFGKHYNTNSTYLVRSDIDLVPDYLETTIGATFPEDPTRTNYTFKGWYDANGAKYQSYNGSSDITLYAKWELENLQDGEEYTLPVNNTSKDSDTYTVTFKYNNGHSDTTSNVVVSYEPNGWLVDGEHHDDGDTIIYTNGMSIVEDYTPSTTGATFPSNPSKNHYEFIGWFNANDGGSKYTSYDKAQNITLYAHYQMIDEPTETYTLGVNDGTKADMVLGTITFKYHNGNSDTTSNIVKYYKPNGWLVDGTYYPDNTTIKKYSDSVIVPRFSEFIRNAEFPEIPTKTGYRFVGWFTEENGGEQVTVLRNSGNQVLHAHYTDKYALIVPGDDFNSTVQSVTSSGSGYTFRKATFGEYNAKKNSLGSNNEISTVTSPYKVYVWKTNKDIVYYSEADVIFLNEDSSGLFKQMDKFDSIDLTGFNTSLVQTTSNMFYNMTNLKELNISTFDTTNVTDMTQMFYFDKSLTNLDLSSFNTSNVTTMKGMFGWCNSIRNLDLSNFDTHNVTSMHAMFFATQALSNLNITGFDTSNVENMASMFNGTHALRSVDLTNFDTSSLTDANSMFTSTGIISLDISSFVADSLTNASQMFNGGTTFTIYASDKWDAQNVTNDNGMFTSATYLKGQMGTSYDADHVNKEYARIDILPDTPGYFTEKGKVIKYTITLPDRVDEVERGTFYYMPDNNYEIDPTNVASVTFKYNNGSEDYVSHVQAEHTPTDWTITPFVYVSNGYFVVEDNYELTPQYVDTVIGASFPEDPIKPGYVFEGWFTELNGGEKVTEYTGDTDVTLYAHWRSELPEPGKDFILPTNNIAKSDATFTVTFKLQNGEDDIVSTIGKQYLPNGWVVDGKHKDDGEAIKINADTTIEPDYTEVALGSFPQNPVKEGYQFVKWTDAPQGGNVYTILLINKDITLYAQYLDQRPPHIIPEGTKCIRARENPLPGSYGTDDSTLSTNNAFDCDLNGNGEYDERFYYISDYYDTETGEFNHDYAVLVYSGLASYDSYYNNHGNVNGPVTAVSELPSTSSWSNVELYKTTRQLRTVNGNNSFDYSVNGVTNLPTINYSGKAARLLTIQEVNEGCGLNVTSSTLSNQRINNKCSFLLEGLSEEAEEPWDPDIYYEMMFENLVDNSSNYLVLDSDGEHFAYQPNSSAVRPVIEVLKDDLDLAIVPSYYTVTYPNGRVDTASNREPYKLADAMVTKDPDILSTVTFKPQNGDPDVTSNVTKTYVQNEWYLRGAHYGGYTAVGNSITVNEDLVVSAPAGAFKSTKHGAVFPENPTKEGYAFNGWFDAPVGGNVYTSYDGTTNKTLYAQYIKIDAEGKITLSKNETPKASKNYINYEFRAYEMVDDPGTPGYMMREEYTFHDTYSQKTYSPNGWLVDGVHYNDFDKVLVTSESVIVPDYIETIVPGVFPDDYPEYPYDPEDPEEREFVGWTYYSNIVTSLDFLPNNGRLYATLYPEYAYDAVNLIAGSSFNTKLKTMISGSGYNGNNLTFRKATETEYNNIKSSLTSANIVSEETDKPAYMWVDATNEVVLFYSEADAIFMNEDSSNMFNNVDELKVVNLSGLNSIKTTNMSGLFSGSDNLSTITLTGIYTGKVTNMSNMFSNLPSITTLNVSGLSTGRVTNMESMFSGDANLTALDLKSFNTNNVTNMANMFKGDSSLSSIDVTTFNVSSVANMSSMFEGCSSVTSLDLSRFKTDALTNASNMFKGASSLTTTDLHNFKTSSVTNMSSMFEGTTSLTTLNISSFDTSSVTNTSNMFKGDSNLTTVYVSSRWDNEGITSSTDMFTGATSIVGQEGTTYSASHTDKEYAVVDKGEERPGYLTFKGVETFKIYIDNVKVQDAVIGEVFVVPSQANKDSETVSTVTFIYNDGNNTTSTSNVVKTYTPAGYSFNDKKYNPEDIITVEEDIYLTSVYTEENVGATFPTPTRDNYTFVGWIKEQTYDPNGTQTKYTSYDGTEDITLYGAWTASSGYHTVTYDNGDVELVAHGDSITVPDKVDDESETLTFTYIAGTSGSITSKSFTRDFVTAKTVDKYSVYSTDYTPGQNIVINSDVFITRSYNGLSYDDTSFEIPNDAYNFIGWFSNETGGKLINSYKEYKENKLTTGNLYGHYNEDGKYTVVLDGVEVGTYNEGSIYTLPEGVNINEDVATVTFINGETSTTAKVHETKTFDYYKVNSFTMVDVIKNVGEDITVNSNIYITSSYKNVTLTPVTITDLADTDYEEFAGWYTKQGGQGAKISGTYSDKVDITLYAYFEGKMAQYSFYDNEHQNHIGYKEAKYGTEIDTTDILPTYEVDSEHTITYKYQNNRPEDDYTVNMKATQKIDHWIRSTDSKEYALVHTVDTVGPISLYAVFTNELLPKVDLIALTSNDYPGYDFVGWYNAPIGGKLLTASDFTEDKDYTVYAHWTRNNDNICTFDDGRTENCPLGETGTVPEEMTTTAAYVNEVANAAVDQYKDYVLNGYVLEKTSVVEYFIIDGVKYLPGSTYTIGENPSITAKYSDEYIEPVTLSTSIPANTISDYFDDNNTHLFDGWYTGRTDGTRVFTYGEAENKDFYAHYKIYDPDAVYYTLRIEHLDGTIDTIENLTQGEKYTLVKDEYVNRDHVIKLYDSDGTTLLGTTTVKFTHTANKWLINGELKNVGSEITILGDTYIKAYETSSNKEVVGYTEPDDNNFIGYFTEVSGGEKVSVNNIKESDNVINTLYAHYKEDVPAGYVQVDFDGDITNVPEGTNITLPTTRTKNGETFDIIFNFNQGSMTSEAATVEKTYTVSSYTVNNVAKNPGEVVTANTNLVIRTKYSENYDYSDDTKSYFNITYPNIPTFDMLDLVPDHWVDSIENGNTVTNVENIKETTNLYAVYTNQANVYLNDEIIATVKVGTNYKLPTNTINKTSDTLATVTFNHLNDDNTVTTSSRYKLYTSNGWTINNVGYNNGANYLVTEDITLVPRYKETIVEAKMPKDPTKTNTTFKGWFTDLEDETTKVESVEGLTEDLVLNALFKNKYKIVDPETGDTEYVEEGTVITLEALDDKEEKFYNITFNYNYDGSPDPKVVRISTQQVFKGWLINGVLHQAGDQITVNEDITKSASYETVINNKNLPNDPTRTGYTFKGWYNSASEIFGQLVDVTKLTTNSTVYAHWEHFDPETQVKLTWDGVTSVHDKGEEISLVKDGSTYTDLIATVTFRMNNANYSDKILKINKNNYIDHLVINNVNHPATGTYTLNEDTTITSVYADEIIYPNIPIISDDTFKGFYTDSVDGTLVTTLEGVNEDKVYYARWETGTVPIDEDGEITDVPIGTKLTLKDGKAKDAAVITLTLDYLDTTTQDVTFTTSYIFSHYLVNGNIMYPGEKYTANEATTITSVYTDDTVSSFTGKYNENWDIGGHHDTLGYITGWLYNNEKVDLDNVDGTTSTYDGKTLTADYKLSGSVNVTIDSMSPYQQNIGRYVLIDPSVTPVLDTPSDDTFTVTYNYNDGTGNTTTVNVGRHYTFSHYTADGKGEYQRDSLYDFGKDTIIKSQYSISYTYPDAPTNSNPRFIGWFTEPVKGVEKSINEITEETTLYAHYIGNNPDTTSVTFDGEIYVIPDGVTKVTPINEGYGANQIINKSTLTLVYDSETIEKHTYQNTLDHVGWTDENGIEYGEVIDFTTPNIGSVFTSRYDDSKVEDIDLSQFDPENNDKFVGWFDAEIGGNKQTTYSPTLDDTLYAHYIGESQVIITVDGEAEIHTIGESYTLPGAKTKAGSSIDVTFDHNDGLGNKTIKSFETIYTFSGYRLEENNELYNGDATFTLENNMTFNSEFTESNTSPTWPDDPTKEHYTFVGWYSAKESGVQVFNYNDIDRNTTLYAHYVKNQEDFIKLTNTLTGEYIQVLSGSDFVFSTTTFNKDVDTKLGTVTFKFNAPGYPDEKIEFKSTNSPSGFYVNNDTENLYDIDETYQFTEDTSITPYYDSNAATVDNHIGFDLFDYELTKDELTPRCFSKTDQTDERDQAEYTCYTEYDSSDGDLTLYLHWYDARQVSVTKPDGTVELFNIYTNYNYGENTIPGGETINYVVTLKYHDGETADQELTYTSTESPNGWIVTGSETGRRHVDDNEIESLVEDIVIEPDYEATESTVTLPTPTRDDYSFVGWNKLENGLGKYYTSNDINGATSSGTLTLHAVWTQDEMVTITFDAQGGEAVASRNVVVGQALGTLPTTKKLGYTFAGWYTDTTYSTEVTANTIAKYETTYYARWIEDTFPDVWEHEPNEVFDGDDYLNSHIKLYSDTNWQKDYEIGLTINSYNHNGTEKQGVFTNAKYENDSLKWPGLVFRKSTKKDTIEITQSINSGNKETQEITLPITYPYQVRIRRHNGMVKTSINHGPWQDLQDMSVFNSNQRHNVETYFGAAASSDGVTPFRFIKAEMSNMYVKLGQIPDDDEVTVTYPDGHTVIKNVGETVDLSEITEISKNDYTLGKVTFKYQDEETADYTVDIVASYTQDGWNVEGDVSGVVGYGFDDVITLSENIKILPKYIETVEPITFPTDPTRENYTFKGWKDTNGTTYTSYSGTDDLTLYAEWEGDLVIPVPGDDPIITPKGSTIQLPENNVAKASENVSKVTFKPENGSSDIERYVLRAFTPNGWLINGTHYDVGDEYVANEVPTLVPDYVSYIVPVEFPEDPTLTDKDFNGWYTLADGGEKITSYSDDENDLILYAQYIDHVPNIVTPGGIEHPDENGNYTFKENIYNKDEELLATVRFVYHNGDSDTYSYVVKQYIKNGWLLDGVHYNTGDVIAVDHDIEIFPDYAVNIKPAEFPADPTVDGDTFVGWFSAKTGGTQYTSYSAAEDITLHAQWENGTDIYPTILCKRATTLHTEKCERTGSTLGCAALGYSNGDTIYYGSLGNGNILARGDAFTCDVNGDGTFDETTERFYYMSDYYDVTTDTYDPDYAVMIYYANLYDVGMMSEHGVSFSTGPDDHAPNNIKRYLPTAELWPNTSLKQNIRYVRDYLNEENIEIDYTGYVARLMNFKEVGYDANGNQDIIPEMFEKSLFNKPNNYNHPQFAYYLESYNGQGSTNYYSSTQMGVSPSGRVEYADNAIGLRPAIDVSKDRIQLVEGDIYTVSIDGEVVESVKAGTIYTIPENTKSKASDTYTVTFNYHNESPETTSSVEVTYLPNGYDVTDNHYNGGEKVVITGNISLTSDYIETVIPAEFPADPTKEDLTFVGWFDQETGGNKYTEYSEKADITLHAQYRGDEIDIIIPDEPPIITPVTPGEPYILPTNDKSKADENVGSVTFIYNDGETPDLTKYVVASYMPNGWLIDNVPYADGAEITPVEDTTLVRNYVETLEGIEWPADPTRDGYGFDGWYTDELLEHKYTGTSYSDKENINLYAKWVEITGLEIDTDDVTLIKGDEHTITVSTIPAGFTPNVEYSGYSDIITVDDSGKVTAVSKGTTTITVTLKSNSEINDTMTVTVLDDEITSEEYTVTTKDLTGEDIKIIIGAEPQTLVKDFLDNIDNPNEYLKVYNKDNELVDENDYESSYITTGSKVKLVIDDHEYDNVLVIVRGDISEDGIVNPVDQSLIRSILLETVDITDYRIYAANVYEEQNETLESAITPRDVSKVADYILENISSLNEKGDD